MTHNSQPLEGLEIDGVDAHCHVDLYPDPRAVIRRAEADRIAMIAVTNTPSVFEKMVALTSDIQHVVPALGLHPELVGARSAELPLLRRLQKQTRFIGEVGLDGSARVRSTYEQQRRVFQAILTTCADAGDKVLTVHSRRAASEVVDTIGGHFPGKIILHWFTGSVSVAKRAVAFGFYFSINPLMVHATTFPLLLSVLPRERILTESDGPLVRIGSRPVEPGDAHSTIEAVSAAWKMGPNEVRAIVVQNFRSCLASEGTD